MMDIISDDDRPAKDRIASAIESDFLYSVMSARTGATHREMRALTRELATFVGKAARGADNEQQFVQNLISGALGAAMTRSNAQPVANPDRTQPRTSGRKPSESVSITCCEFICCGGDVGS